MLLPLLRVHEALDKFLGPEIRTDVLKRSSPQDEQLREVTILSGWVESTLVRDLGMYFTEMESAIRRHRGLVVQFISDEIEALFGAPTQCAEHADMAVAAALDMRRRLEALNLRRTRGGNRALRHGIGIHTGTVPGGAIGNATRVPFALLGDAVNVASQIQELNKDLGSDILVSGMTRGRVRRRFDFAQIDPTRLLGRTEGISVYRVR